jgi:hypothetical protein
MAATTPKRWDEGQARRIIARADRSGLSDRAFARREGFDPQRLSWWRRRLGEVSGGAETAPFVEVRAKVSGRVEERIEIDLVNGRVARVGAAIDPVVLAKLLDAIEGRRC